MMDSNTQQLVPGAAVRIGAGRLMVTVRAASGVEVSLVDLGDPAGTGARIRGSGSGTWWVELHEGSTGTLAVKTRDGRLFPDGSTLDVALNTGTTELRARPFPDVSGLRAPELVVWRPAPAGPLGPRVELQVLDVSATAVRGEPGYDQSVARLPVEPLGETAMLARNLAREQAGGPLVPASLQRDVHLVLDGSTSMQPIVAGPDLADAVAVVLGAADVISLNGPQVWTANGPQVSRVEPPTREVSSWLPEVYRPHSFGCSVEAVRQSIPVGRNSRVVLLVTDEVPADVGGLRASVADGREADAADRWEILVLGHGGPSRRANGLPAGVRLVPVSGVRGPEGRLQPDGVRRVVAGLIGGLS